MTEQDKGIIVKTIPVNELPQTADGQTADLTLHGHMETRGLEGESDPHWWKQSKVEGTDKPTPELEKLLTDETPFTLGPRGRFLAQLQTEQDADAFAAAMLQARLADPTIRFTPPVRPKKRESQATRNYRNVMNGLIARAAK